MPWAPAIRRRDRLLVLTNAAPDSSRADVAIVKELASRRYHVPWSISWDAAAMNALGTATNHQPTGP